MTTVERVKELLDYDATTGAFRWRVAVSNFVKVGDLAGWDDGYGYFVIAVDRVRHKAHRLAWLYVHGEWPNMEIDHVNGDPGDNRIANLRLATRSQNEANKPPSSHKKWKGVRRAGRKWRATFMGRHIGVFSSDVEAAKAYDIEASRVFGDFAYLNLGEVTSAQSWNFRTEPLA